MNHQILRPLPLRSVHLEGGFWEEIVQTVREVMIPYQWQVLNDSAPDAEPSCCISNFKIAAGLKSGSFKGMVFQDSDLAKWLEAVAYALTMHPDKSLEEEADQAIELIRLAQRQDGYLDTYFIVKEPEKRWENLRDCHELYCMGHMMEAAVAYYEATNKRVLLDVMLKAARHIDTVLGPEEGKLHGYPGHEEIELALIRMYRATGEEFLLRLAKYFIDERGKQPSFFVEESRRRQTEGFFPNNAGFGLSYNQSHLPVRQQTTMEGHSVRALYLLSGMIDVAAETNDEGLLESCRTMFDNAVNRRMYITGGVGSTHVGEAFTLDYDLPNDTVYAETCASIALIFSAWRLMQISPDGKYADVIEKALYNTCIAGMARDGRHFFYVNPLEVLPEASEKNPDRQHVLPVRPTWFGCACCPPNLARLLCSLGQYAYSVRGREAFIHLYLAGEATFTMDGQTLRMRIETDYPRDGRVVIYPAKGRYVLRLHKPGWCKHAALTLNGKDFPISEKEGYLSVDTQFADGDVLVLKLDMPPRREYANPRVVSDVDCVAILRGPVVYCVEEADAGPGLWQIHLKRESCLREVQEDGPLGHLVRIQADILTTPLPLEASLYSEKAPIYSEASTISLIPYYAWANRGAGEMRVWLHESK